MATREVAAGDLWTKCGLGSVFMSGGGKLCVVLVPFNKHNRTKVNGRATLLIFPLYIHT